MPGDEHPAACREESKWRRHRRAVVDAPIIDTTIIPITVMVVNGRTNSYPTQRSSTHQRIGGGGEEA